MVEMKEQEWEKRNELVEGIARLGISMTEATKIFEYLEDECVIEITPPLMEEPVMQKLYVSAAHTGRFKGTSYKYGNIVLNIKNAVMESLALGTSIAATIGALSTAQPVMATLTIMGAVLSAANLAKIELDANAVLILVVLWENRNTYDQWIDAGVGLELVNQYLETSNREKFSEVFYNDLLDDLRSVDSIALHNGKIKLNEKIHIKY